MTAKKDTAKQKRAVKRRARVDEGLALLKVWLVDAPVPSPGAVFSAELLFETSGRRSWRGLNW